MAHRSEEPNFDEFVDGILNTTFSSPFNGDEEKILIHNISESEPECKERKQYNKDTDDVTHPSTHNTAEIPWPSTSPQVDNFWRNVTNSFPELSTAFSNLKKSETYEIVQSEISKSTDKQEPKASSSGETSNVKKITGTTGNSVLVNPKQRGNPLLKAISNVPWEFDDSIVPDYVMGRTTCALFLSLRYHNLKPEYINERLRLLGKLYDLRVLLVQIDMKDPHHALKHLTRVCLLADLTLMLAWSAEEAGRIIETYKIFQHKPPDLIMERQESDPHLKLVNALTCVRSVNKTDATTLLSTFGSLGKIVKAPQESLALCPGLGPQKATRLYKALHQPFLKTGKVAKRKTALTKFLKGTTSQQ